MDRTNIPRHAIFLKWGKLEIAASGYPAVVAVVGAIIGFVYLGSKPFGVW